MKSSKVTPLDVFTQQSLFPLEIKVFQEVLFLLCFDKINNLLLVSLVLGDFLRSHPHGSALMDVKLYDFVTFLSCSHNSSNDEYKNLVN